MRFLKSLYKFLSPKHQNLFLEYKVNFEPRYGHGKTAHPLLYPLINESRKEYADYLKQFLKYQNVFHSIKTISKEANDSEPTWNNNFLPGLDIVALYGLLNLFSPKQYVEVGSGNSTKVARKAIRDNHLATKIISIDPFPRANIDKLSDTIIRQAVENLDDYSFAEQLQENDILFIDNSHRCFPNSDVTVCFLDILPNLRKGVIVHIHDIYLPYDYPQFMCDRFYSEQYLLAVMLLANPEKYKIILPNYFVSEDKELSSVLHPVWQHENLKNVEQHGGSFWFKIA